MSLTSIGIDPGSDYLGVGAARVDACGNFIHAELHRVRVAGRSLESSVAMVGQLLTPLIKGETILSYEMPPPTSRKDTSHGFQTPIGFRLGLISGAIVSPYLAKKGVEVRETTVADWRNNLLLFAAVNGPKVARPSRKRLVKSRHGKLGPVLQSPLTPVELGGWIGKYSCGHQVDLPNLNAVKKASQVCVLCVRKESAPENAAKAVRDAWKCLACQVIQKHFPQQYKYLVLEARKAARTNPLDHRLSGVADACEALCIAMAALPRITEMRKVS